MNICRLILTRCKTPWQIATGLPRWAIEADHRIDQEIDHESAAEKCSDSRLYWLAFLAGFFGWLFWLGFFGWLQWPTAILLRLPTLNRFRNQPVSAIANDNR
jgi:hypothetical protein